MPKELTHWVIARKAATNIDPRVGRIIENNMDFYLTGAVVIDSPYYAVFGGDVGLYKQAGGRLHGMGAVTPCEAVSQVAHVVKDGGDEALAFMIGAFTHLITDAVFHPMIYYLTGDYDDPDVERRKKAVTRHRTLETWLDVWFSAESDVPPTQTFHFHATRARSKSKNFGRLASALFFGRDDNVPPALKAIGNHSVIQSLFHSRMAAKLVSIYGRLARRDMGEFEALFYPPSGYVVPSVLSTSFRYKNPITGEAFEKTLDELEKEALGLCARLFSLASSYPDPKAFGWECCRLVPSVRLKERKFGYFATEREMDELWHALSYFRTHVRP